MAETLPKGLAGVYVDETKIATTDTSGNLVYRGYRVVDLAENLDFETIAYLVLNGSLPSDQEITAFKKMLSDSAIIDDSTARIIDILRGRKLIDLLRTAVSSVPSDGRSPDALVRLAAKFPEIVIYGEKGEHLSSSEESFAGRFYKSLTGSNDKEKSSLFEKILIMYMEHEFNASTYALRITASTMADPVCGLTTALSTLKGPLHGGANSEILQYLLNFKSKEEALAWVDGKLARKELLMGFGHRVYKAKDPRAQFIKGILLKNFSDVEAVQYATAIENYVWEKKALAANLDFYAALYMHLLGIEEKYYLAIFATARVFGWISHYLEQQSNNKMIRPLALYTGLTDMELP